MSLATQVAALATRIGAEIKAVRLAKADDSTVVHLSGAETISGRKTFGSAPLVPVGDLLANPVRRDDARLSDARTPTAHASTHATSGSDPITPAGIGAATATHLHEPSVVDLGSVSGTLTLAGAAGPRQRGLLVGDVALAAPSGGVAGRVVVASFTASAASRVVTVGSAIGRMAGYPATFQVPTGKAARVVLEWFADQGRWVLLAHGVEQ